MPPATLSTEKMLQVIYRQQKLWKNEEIVSIDLSTIEKAIKNENIDASTRTIYRKLQELRKNELITQTVGYFRKYQLEKIDFVQDMIIVDENDKRIPRTEMKNMIDKKAPYVLKEIGEIKTQLFEITEKGKQLLEKLK
jgi:Fe2+ or Zn2+ uptake regulation protein